MTMIKGLPAHRARERGTITILAAFLALAVGGLSLGLLQEGLASRQTLVRNEDSLRALEEAETGLARAEEEISSLVDTAADGIGNLVGPFAGGSYAVTATQDPLLPDRWTLRATGRRGSGVRRIEVGLRRTPNAMFRDALLSNDDLVIGGTNRTDAYDSALGTYVSQAVNLDEGGTYALDGGSIGSNAGIIQLNGSSIYVRGDAIPGPLHTVSESGNPVVTGDTTPRKQELDLPPPPLADFEAALASGDNGSWTLVGGSLAYDAGAASLALSGKGTLTLPGGTYFFSSFTASGNSKVVFEGPTKIYVTGSLDMSGGTVLNASGSPSDLQIYAHPYPLPTGFAPLATTVKLNGGVNAAWALYGPQAEVTIGGGGDVYGSTVAKKITIGGNCFFHYDRALEDVGLLGPALIERFYWREASPPRR